MNREVADLAVAWTTQPPDYENYINTKPLSLLNLEDPYLSVAWTTRPPDRTNYINTILLSLTRHSISLDPYSQLKKEEEGISHIQSNGTWCLKIHTPSVSGTCISATSVSGGLPPSRGHPSRAAFLRLGDIRLGRPSSVSGTSVSGGLPSRGHPSRAAFLRLGDIRLGAIRHRDWEG